MGDKQFSVFQSDLTTNLGERGDISSKADDWINTAYMTLVTQSRLYGVNVRKRFYFPELETVSSSTDTTDGTAYISTPSDCLIVRAVWDSTNDNMLTKVSWRDYLSRTGRADSDAEGIPQDYCRNGSRIYLGPTPDDAYAMYVYHRKRVTLMSDDDDTTDIGTEWDEVIVKLATVQSLLRLKDYEAYKIEKAELISMIQGVIDIYEQEELDRRDIRKPDPAYNNYEY